MIWLLLAAGAPPVEVALLDGRSVRGELAELSPTRTLVHANGESVSIPAEDLLRIDIQVPNSNFDNVRLIDVTVRLVDGSQFSALSFESDGRVVKCRLRTEELSIAAERVAAVLFVDDPHEAAEFAALAREKLQSDRAVLARDGKRLALDGVVNKIGAEKLELALDGDALPINRSRVRALYFAQKAPPAPPAAVVGDKQGNLWAAASWRWHSGGVALTSPSGFERRIPIDALSSIDFSAGRVAFLSDLEPKLMQHTPAFDHPWPMKRDRGPHDGALELGGRRFAKGLVLHSRTVVEYSLGGADRRFHAVVGIPAEAGPLGDADVRILADGEPVFTERLRAGAKPRELRLSIAGVKTFRLEVDFGKNLDFGDHVAFADAKVFK